MKQPERPASSTEVTSQVPARPTPSVEDIEASRRELLGILGGSRHAIQEVLKYCSNPFDPSLLAGADVRRPILPLPSEEHVERWRRYIVEATNRPFAFLQERLPQLNIPIRDGVSATEAYANVMRRGHRFVADDFGGQLVLRRPDLFRLVVREHRAGALPVLSTPERVDFETLHRALGCRSEPVTIAPAVNAQMIAGLTNWDRVRRYRDAWEAERPAAAADGWADEMRRVARLEPWRFQDRLILTTDQPYSGVEPGDLGLALDRDEWIELSSVIRIEHEFTHYATKRLYGLMRNNLLDEIIADHMGLTEALGQFRADWFLAFMGLEKWPDVRPGGRIHVYCEHMDNDTSSLIGRLTVEAAVGLERISGTFYTAKARPRFFLALTFMTLELLARSDCERWFAEAYERAGVVVGPEDGYV